MTVKSFRGLILDTTHQTLSLRTNNGSVGYRITKFDIIGEKPGTSQAEFIVKIYKVENNPEVTTPTQTIDFSDNTLLAAAFMQQQAGETVPYFKSIIFDNEIFNQDIYITCKDTVGGDKCNYYIELEQIKLSLDENTVATLKDIRNIEQPSV
tara:strand:- start:210 stop:665 length:456 start_codon:yes stop_codon:yes gene_type:complete